MSVSGKEHHNVFARSINTKRKAGEPGGRIPSILAAETSGAPVRPKSAPSQTADKVSKVLAFREDFRFNINMLKKEEPQQTGWEWVTIESLIPGDHLLRKIDRCIDFSFIHERVSHLYCVDNGRPALDPTLLFKALFIGYLFGIRSERALMREIEVNVAYRWFLGLGLTDRVPDASTISQNRRRRFNGSGVHQEIFDEIVFQALNAGLVEGHVIYTDSTLLKANANREKFDLAMVEKTRVAYWDELDRAIEEDRLAHGKKPFSGKPRRKTGVCQQSGAPLPGRFLFLFLFLLYLLD